MFRENFYFDIWYLELESLNFYPDTVLAQYMGWSSNKLFEECLVLTNRFDLRIDEQILYNLSLDCSASGIVVVYQYLPFPLGNYFFVWYQYVHHASNLRGYNWKVIYVVSFRIILFNLINISQCILKLPWIEEFHNWHGFPCSQHGRFLTPRSLHLPTEKLDSGGFNEYNW